MMQNPIHPEKDPLAYARAQVKEVISFRKFVQHIAEHGGYTRGKVKGVLADMCTCLVEMLLDGKKVQLDELGDFWISLSCDGAETVNKFTADNIKAVNIIFTPGPDFENLISKAEFETVASRAAQAATLKAEKEGKSTVDLEAAKKKPTTNKEDGTGDNKEEGTGDNKEEGTGDTTQGGGSENTGGTGSENGDSGDLGL